jgi:hypothetical protein
MSRSEKGSVLIPGLFKYHSETPEAKQFHLYHSQCREMEGHVVHNGSWYNQDGLYLGFGDLNALDLVRIPACLRRDDLFIVLHESAAYDIQQKAPAYYCDTGFFPTHENPGLRYLAQHAAWVLHPMGGFSSAPFVEHFCDEESLHWMNREVPNQERWVDGPGVKVKVQDRPRRSLYSRLLGKGAYEQLVCRHFRVGTACYECDRAEESSGSTECSL